MNGIPASDIIHRVWAMEHHPPKETNARMITNLSWKEIIVLDNDGTPFVISRNERKRRLVVKCVKGNNENNWIKIEKSMIYPPIFVMVSKLFMIHSSIRFVVWTDVDTKLNEVVLVVF